MYSLHTGCFNTKETSKLFPCFFLSCKAINCLGITRKDGHGLHSSQLRDNFYAVSSSLILIWPLWVRIPESFPTKVVNCVVLCTVVLPPGGNTIAVNKYIISYHIIYHIMPYHIPYLTIYHTSYQIISYIISYHIISYHIISCHVMSCHIISYHII